MFLYDTEEDTGISECPPFSKEEHLIKSIDMKENIFSKFWQWAGTTQWIHNLWHLPNIPVKLYKKLMLKTGNQDLTCSWNFTNSLPVDYYIETETDLMMACSKC